MDAQLAPLFAGGDATCMWNKKNHLTREKRGPNLTSNSIRLIKRRRRRLRLLLVESLEDRQLLALSPIDIKSGDIAPIFLRQPSDAIDAQFRFKEIATIGPNGARTVLTQKPVNELNEKGFYSLNVGSLVAGYFYQSTSFDNTNSFWRTVHFF